MKKKIAWLLLMSSLVLGLAACGNQSAPDLVDTPAPTIEATVEPTAESTEAPTPEPTQEPTPEPTEAPTEAPAPELIEEQTWIDTLYNKLVTLDVDGVIEILKDPGLIEKAEPYLYPDYKVWDYEEGYKLVTSNDKIVGIITSDDSIYAFYAPNGYKDGFSEILSGDICIYIEGGKVGYFDGETLHLEGQEDFYVGSDNVWMVWHY